uniref:C2 domain-containing protein n=1 Tax=Elaeophora elaphi TaxID=1147741 RepID=A0A0R3S382_9BILA
MHSRTRQLVGIDVPFLGISPYIRREISEETRCLKLKSPVPVPGTWSGPDYHEMNISHNKRLHRPETYSDEKVSEVFTTKYNSCTIPAMTICAPKLKSHQPVEITLSCAFQPPIESNEKVSFSQKSSRLIKMDKKLLALMNVTTKFDASFTSRTPRMKDALDIIKVKRKHTICSMIVKEPTVRIITIRELIRKKSDGRNSCRAQVTVLTSPVTDVNFCRCLKHVQITRSKRHSTSIESISKQAHIVEENNAGQKVTNEMNCASDQLLSREINANEALSENDDDFIFPGHSALEKYVKYKRDKWKRLHSESVESDHRESSCPLAASELKRACAVRIVEPPRQLSYITAPSRSRLGSVEMETFSTPARTFGEQLLSTNYHGVKKSSVDRSERSMSLTKPSFEFDPAMSPFEQTLQNQAFQLRKISTFSDGDIPTIQLAVVAAAAPTATGGDGEQVGIFTTALSLGW